MELVNKKTTRIIWNHSMDDLENKYRIYIERYPYLKEEKYSHKREQLYLMLQYGMSETFIESFFQGDENITSRDLDFIRMICMLFDEKFVTDHFYKKEQSLEQAKEIVAEKMLQDYCADLPKLEQLVQEQKWMQERFELQCEFLEKERENANRYYEEMLSKERQLWEERANNKWIKMEAKSEELTGKLLCVEKEKSELKVLFEDTKVQHQNAADQWEAEKNRLLEKCGELKKQLNNDMNGQETSQGSFFMQYKNKKEQQRKRKEKEERNQFVLTLISNPEFTKEQLEFIVQAVQADLSLQELQQLCNPKFDIQKMEILTQFYIKQKGMA